MRRITHVFLLICVCAGTTAAGKEEKRTCSMGRDYWLYTPAAINKNKTYWLVVGVHGFRGKGSGAGGLAGWVNTMDNVIVVGPSFPSTGPYYQGLGGKTDKQLLDIHKDLQKEFKLHAKMFLHGFSGGSQYAHRFANKHPKNVIGVSAHSGGTWENPSALAKSVLWTVSCGLKDTGLSTGGAKLSRIDYFRAFFAGLHKAGGFTCKPFVTQQGHKGDNTVRAATLECFRVSTTGMFDYQRKATEGLSPGQREAWLKKDIKLQEKEFNDGKNNYKLKVNQEGWTVGPAAISAMAETRAALDKLPH